jgi:hypothetical protein
MRCRPSGSKSKVELTQLEGQGQNRTEFHCLLRRWLTCPNLAKPAEIDSSTPRKARQPITKWTSEPQGRAARIGSGRKFKIQTEQGFCMASIRIADFGLLMEFNFWISDAGVRITSDLLNINSWMLRAAGQEI